jgi:hypothetical protein
MQTYRYMENNLVEFLNSTRAAFVADLNVIHYANRVSREAAKEESLRVERAWVVANPNAAFDPVWTSRNVSRETPARHEDRAR